VLTDKRYLNYEEISTILNEIPTLQKENSNKKRKTMKGVISPKSKKLKSERKVVNTTKYNCLSSHNSQLDSFILDFYLKSIKEQPEPLDMVWLMTNCQCQQICCGSWIENQDIMDEIQRFELFHSTKPKFVCLPVFEGHHVFSVIIHIEPTFKSGHIYWFDSGPKSEIEPLAIQNIKQFVKQISSLIGGIDTEKIHVDTSYLVSPNQKRKSNLCWAFCIQTFISMFDSPVDTFENIKKNQWSSFLVPDKIKGLRSLIKDTIQYYKACEHLNCEFVSVSETDMTRHMNFAHCDTTLAVPELILGEGEGVDIEQDLIRMAASIVEELKTRWTFSKPGVEGILDRVMGWKDAELRINLLGWLATRTDERIQKEAVEMVSTLETVAYTSKITKMGEDIMTDVVELCTMMTEDAGKLRTSENELHIDKEIIAQKDQSIENLYDTDADKDDLGKYSDGEDMQVDQEILLETGIKDALADNEVVSYCPVEITPMVRCSKCDFLFFPFINPISHGGGAIMTS
jgi:hypothetical protein